VSATLDANVLIYASNSADPAHRAARELVERLAAGPDLLYLFWPTILGFLRIGTHPAILPRPLTPRDALANVSNLLALPHVRSPGEAEGFWEFFLATAGEHPRGDEIPDAHLATLMRQHGVRLVYTRDRGFRRFEGIDVRDPFV
jgi:uncharacterized protein